MTSLVALLVEDERTFGLFAWDKAIPMLARKGFLVTHAGVVPGRLKQYHGFGLILWYLRVLGLYNLVMLGLFSVLEHLRRRGSPRTWEELALEHGLVLRRFPGPNTPEAQEFLRASECDILFILVPYIINRKTLQIPKLGTINKHAAVLPSCKGLFPYLWGTMYGDPLGVSFHRVTPEVDAGELLVQARPGHSRHTHSMLAFYVWVYSNYAAMAVEAATRLRSGRGIAAPEGVDSSYYSLPTRADRVAFERRGGRIARWSDLRLTLGAASKIDTGASPEVPLGQPASGGTAGQAQQGPMPRQGKVISMPAALRPSSRVTG